MSKNLGTFAGNGMRMAYQSKLRKQTKRKPTKLEKFMKYKDSVLFETKRKKPATYFARPATENVVIDYDPSMIRKIPGKHRKLSHAARSKDLTVTVGDTTLTK